MPYLSQNSENQQELYCEKLLGWDNSLAMAQNNSELDTFCILWSSVIDCDFHWLFIMFYMILFYHPIRHCVPHDPVLSSDWSLCFTWSYSIIRSVTVFHMILFYHLIGHCVPHDPILSSDWSLCSAWSYSIIWFVYLMVPSSFCDVCCENPTSYSRFMKNAWLIIKFTWHRNRECYNQQS